MGDIVVDHSMCGYLQRRTTEELRGMLAYYLQEKQYVNYAHVILEILRILNTRCVQDAPLEMALWAYEQLLQNTSKADRCSALSHRV